MIGAAEITADTMEAAFERLSALKEEGVTHVSARVTGDPRDQLELMAEFGDRYLPALHDQGGDLAEPGVAVAQGARNGGSAGTDLRVPTCGYRPAGTACGYRPAGTDRRRGAAASEDGPR